MFLGQAIYVLGPLDLVNDESHEQLRVHSRASGTRLIRRSVRYVCCSPMFPSVLSLGSTNSVPSRPGLFVGFSYYEEV
jgi:hypothetical protein